MRRSLIGLIALPVIGLLLLPTASNVAANALPDAWKPYLWLAWPVGVLMAVPMIYGEIRQRPRYGPGAVDDQQKRLRRAEHDIAQAVYRQWTKEAGLRSLHSPEPIRVSWSSIGRPVAADLSRVLAEDAVVGRPLRLRGDIGQVTEVFCHVRARQLVVLGEPAAGKSVMALLLTLGLLPTAPVPVLLAVSSWNPHKEDLHFWVARRIVEEYPALANSDVYGPAAAMRLVTEKRVVPVLDGLDEMSAALQPVAINAIDRAVTDQYPLVVTCRRAEYHGAVDRNGRFLPHAAVLEIQPVDIDGAADFLCGANPRYEYWQPVLNHLRTNLDGPLARALRSPLMIDLARTVYATSAGNPAELLDTARFSDQSKVEHHLLNAFLLVAYENRPAPPGSQPGPVPMRYSPERVGEWLRFLANHLNTRGDYDLAWWQLEYAVSRLIRGVSVGLLTGLVFGLAEGCLLGPSYGLAYALTFGLTAGFASGCGHPRNPSRIEIRFRGNGRSLVRRLAASLAIGLGLTPITGPVEGIVYTVVFMVALSAHLWLDVPPDVTTASTPMDVLKQDRRAALTLGVVLVLVLGPMAGSSLVSGPGFALGPMNWVAAELIGVLTNAVVGTIMGGFIFGRAGAIAFGIAGAVTGGLTFNIIHDGMTPRILGLAAGIVFGLIIGCLGVLSRAWGAFALARLWLALRGHLPWRLMRFLDDAHSRGVLRQSGTVYQFRHERFQNHLATQATRSSFRGT
jgi:hypothetical protein